MTGELDDGELDRVLRATPGPAPAHAQVVFDEVWARVSSAIDQPGPGPSQDVTHDERARARLLLDRERSARRRRRVNRLATAALVVAVASGGTAAAAEFLSARTGQSPTGWEIGAGGSGEILDRGGDDLAAVVAAETADIRFPAGYGTEREFALGFYAPAEGGSAITVSHLRSSIAGAAVCSWTDAWAASNATGDTAGQDAATAQLQAAVNWEPFTTFATDHQELAPADSAVPQDSYRWWLRPLAQAASAGDRQQVLDLVAASGTCTHQLIPVIDADPDYPQAGVR